MGALRASTPAGVSERVEDSKQELPGALVHRLRQDPPGRTGLQDDPIKEQDLDGDLLRE